MILIQPYYVRIEVQNYGKKVQNGFKNAIYAIKVFVSCKGISPAFLFKLNSCKKVWLILDMVNQLQFGIFERNNLLEFLLAVCFVSCCNNHSLSGKSGQLMHWSVMP